MHLCVWPSMYMYMGAIWFAYVLWRCLCACVKHRCSVAYCVLTSANKLCETLLFREVDIIQLNKDLTHLNVFCVWPLLHIFFWVCYIFWRCHNCTFNNVWVDIEVFYIFTVQKYTKTAASTAFMKLIRMQILSFNLRKAKQNPCVCFYVNKKSVNKVTT